MSYYSTIFDKLYRQGHFKVIAIFDLGDFVTFKPSIFLLAIQGIDFRLIALLNTLQLAIFEKKMLVTLTLMTSVLIKLDTDFGYVLSISTKN